MAKTNRRPTDAELEILQVLWEIGPSTVRQVHAVLEPRRGAGQTTILKLMQIMTEKGWLRRDETVRPQVFTPARPRKQMQRQLLGDMVDRVFSGEPGPLVLQALASRKTTPEERAAIRRLLDELEAGR